MEIQAQALKPTKSAGIFGNRNFMLLFSGRVVSQIGDNIYLFALVWYLLGKSNAAIQTSMLLMLSIVPQIIIGPFAGVVVDRIDRKKILVGADLIRGAILLVMSLLLYNGSLSLGLLYTGTVLLGVFSSFYNPACTASIPNIVESEQLTRANSMNSISINGSRVLGILAGGVLYSVLGIKGIFLVNAVSFIISAFSQLFIAMPHVPAGRPQGTGDGTDRSPAKRFVNEMMCGFAYLRSRRGLFVLFIFLVVLNVFNIPLLQICFPFIFNKLFHATTQHLAYANVAFALGYLTGALVTSSLPRTDKYHRRIIVNFSLASVLVLFFTIPLIPGISGFMPLTGKIVLYIILAFVCGMFMALGDIPITVIFQKKVEDVFRGRVSSLLNTFTNAATPVGFLLLGFMCEVSPMYLTIPGVSLVLLGITLAMLAFKDIKEL